MILQVFDFPYEGMRNGQSKEAKQGSGFNEKASDQSAPYTLAESAGPNWPLIKASEVSFLRAEGALIGWNMGGSSAKDFYDIGIQSVNGRIWPGRHRSGW